MPLLTNFHSAEGARQDAGEEKTSMVSPMLDPVYCNINWPVMIHPLVQ